MNASVADGGPALLGRLAAAVYMCDAEGRITKFNRAAADLWGREPAVGDEWWCGSYRIFHPDGRPMPLDECPMAVTLREGRAPAGAEIVVERPDGERRVVRPYPEPLFDADGTLVGAVNLLIDVTDARAAETRARLLIDIHEATRPVDDPDEVARIAADLLRRRLGVDSCAYLTVDPVSGNLVAPGPSGRAPEFSACFGPECGGLVRAGRSFVVRDAEAHPRSVRVLDGLSRAGTGSLVCAPILRSGRTVAVIVVRSAGVRHWRDDEVRLVEDVAALAWESVERARATRALRASEQRYKAIVESQSEMVCRFRPDGTILFVNNAYARALNTTPEKITRMNFWDFIPEADRPAVRAMLDRLTPDRPQDSVENRFDTATGERWTLWTNRALAFDEDGVLLEAQSSGLDISDRKLAETVLKESEEKFRALANAAPVLIWQAGPDAALFWFNTQWVEFVGRPMEALAGRGWEDDLHPDDRGRWADTYRGAFEARRPFRMECRLRHRGGEYRWVLNHGVPVHRSGAFEGFIGSCIDVTDRKRAEEALTLRERYLRAVIETTPECVKIVRRDGAIEYVNPAGLRIFGADAERPPTRMLDLVAPEHRARYWDMHERVCAGEHATLEFDVIGLHGERRHMTTKAVPLPRPDGETSHLALTRDVTEQRRAERALRESEERFRMLADNMSQCAWICDEKGSVSWYNRRWYELTGARPGEADGLGWKAFVDPAQAGDVIERFLAALAAGTEWEDTIRFRDASGAYRWFLARAVPITDGSGRVTRWFGTNTDITALREAEELLSRHTEELERRVRERTEELRASHARLRLSERMASLGTLSAGLGHDMGNLLVPVRVCVETLEAADLPPDLREAVAEIKTSARYLQQLANGLRLMVLDPERTGPAQVTDLREWWTDARQVMKTTLSGGVTLNADIPEGCRAAISKAALTQTVFNLVQNAGEALRGRDRGEVRVTARREPDGVLLTVEDNGPGMSASVRDRCLEPFFTTKTRDISTGLGLVLVSGLVRDAGGSIQVHSEPERGTRFEIRLPLEASDRADRARTGVGRGAVAVADPRTRAFAAAEMRSGGLEIVEAEGAEPIDLAVIDDAGAAERWAARAGRVILLADGPAGTDNVTVIGARPKPTAVRDAVRPVIEGLRRGVSA